MLEVRVFVVDGGGRLHDSPLSSGNIGVHKGNTKLSLAELLANLMCVVLC